LVATSVAVAQTPKRAATHADPTSIDRVLATQVALDRAGFSPGEIDGKRGKNTDRALRAFQQAHGLPETGELDPATLKQLGPVVQNPLSSYAISAEDAAGPFTKAIPKDMMKQSELPSMGYTSIRELLAERFHANLALLARLNQKSQFNEGDVITVPNVEPFFPPVKGQASGDATAARGADQPSGRGAPAGRANSAARGTTNDATRTGAPRSDLVITVTDTTKTLTVQDAAGNVVFFAPVTVGSTHDPLPVGDWKVNGVQRNPAFNYNPELFWDANPTQSKAKLAPGPNNPVGSVWIDLSKEHYGIHGTPEPSRIGYTESHGCIRLTNWDAVRLAQLVGPGTKVVLR